MTPPVLPIAEPVRPRVDVVYAVAGVLQLVAMLTPSARVRLYGVIPFFKLPTAGVVLIVLAVLTIGVAFRADGWWRWIPGVMTALVICVAHWRIIHNPSGLFFDPVVRRLVHPAWGFGPMYAAVLLSLAASVRPRRTRPVAIQLQLPI